MRQSSSVASWTLRELGSCLGGLDERAQDRGRWMVESAPREVLELDELEALAEPDPLLRA